MVFLAFILWLYYAVMIALDDDSGERLFPEEIRLLVLTYAIAFTVFPFLLLARAGILLGAVYKQSAPLVMGGILNTVVELVSIVCLCVCSFMFFHPVAGAVTVLFMPITIFTLVPLISYYLQLRAGRTSDSVHVGVVYSTGQPPDGYTYTGQPWFARGAPDPVGPNSQPQGLRAPKVTWNSLGYLTGQTRNLD